uniref:Transcription elongation factor, mitochondrial n=1 Tax=Geotrypetes seraphini TaxID=260995 RepID=A0A6P8STY2_GEOSA|nr:transcription elongation factor, mitochondrial isoform X2 [Geotrypetes seraphini]
MSLRSFLTCFRAGTILWQSHQELYSTFRCRTLQYSCWWGKALTLAEGIFSNSLPPDQSSREPEREIDDKYTTEQRSAILQVLNTASETELLNIMGGKKPFRIVDYRTKHGPFQNVQSLMKVPQFKYKTTVQVCDLILDPAAREQRKKKTWRNRQAVKYIESLIELEKLQTAESIVSIVFGTQKIAWAHVSRNLSVLDWQRVECHGFMKKPYKASAYLEEIFAVVSKIPEADFYILEKSTLSVEHNNLIPLMFHRRSVEAILFALFNVTFMTDGQHRVLCMSRYGVGKHFDLIVGGARTSGRNLAMQLFLEAATSSKPQVSFSKDLLLQHRNLFETESRNREEEMCDALLQALAFCDWVVQ